jgi:hypothetical protein
MQVEVVLEKKPRVLHPDPWHQEEKALGVCILLGWQRSLDERPGLSLLLHRDRDNPGNMSRSQVVKQAPTPGVGTGRVWGLSLIIVSLVSFTSKFL